MKRPPATATYLYCLVRAPRRPDLGKAPRGLPGLAPPRALPAGDRLWLVAGDAPLSRYGADAIARGLRDLTWVSTRALAHEQVVEHCTQAGTVVPMKLFTLFTSDARAVRHIQRARPGLTRLLARLAGRQEWGVRLGFDPIRAAAAARGARRRDAGRSPGRDFLLRKRAEQDAARRLAARAQREATGLFRELARAATEARRRPIVTSDPAARVLLDAAFLVPAGRAARFRAAVRRLKRRLGPAGYEVTLTGPWPPYNFLAERA